jgi:ADP-dependent NAD(P)H-hydrate dehydratase / NAD(P)H-hydrate epimerase
MPVPILSVAQMRQWEQSTWATGQTEAAVIARVGGLLARRALRMTPDDGRILLLAGKGHNGDDARQAAPHLLRRQVALLEIADPSNSLDELRKALAHKPDLVIDGLFGIGLNRPLSPAWYELIKTVNQSGGPVLAVDNPSGLNVETGTVEGAAIQATRTLTLGAPKRGLFSTEAIDVVGRLEVAPEIGLAPCPVDSELWWTLDEDFESFPPPRPVAGHKGTFGHLGIVAGSRGYHGAAVLAARGAQRAQPGLITLMTQENVYVPVASHLQAVMVRAFAPQADLSAYTALLLGPGLASPELDASVRKRVERLWIEASVPVMVDASALEWLPTNATATGDAIRVITPHPGEAARLLSMRPAEVQADRPKALRKLSRRYGGCWVVLKGHQTLVGRKEGPIFMNGTGNPALAQGGSGDVLAGFLGGALAQPALQKDPLTTIRYAVWAHGAAADLLENERPGWVVEELVERLGDSSCG